MNINEAINNLISVDQQIKSINDSVSYINNTLVSYYNTQDEKNDIRRNIEHIRTMLTKDYIISRLSEDDITRFTDIIHKGESVLQ